MSDDQNNPKAMHELKTSDPTKASFAPCPGSDSGPVMIVDEARVNYFARKFYPHLTQTYGRLCILESLRAALSPNDQAQ